MEIAQVVIDTEKLRKSDLKKVLFMVSVVIIPLTLAFFIFKIYKVLIYIKNDFAYKLSFVLLLILSFILL